ncbi:MAG: proline--tRNA ligase [Bacteroidales bacterium]|jgi:prolyl-tRNA synthetase|nr:proline--tRNA ligase [Bacteroidales bacterium]
MKLSKLVFETTKEAPAGAKIISHILLSRSGFIKQVANGIYTLGMPAQKMALKIENIIRDEMNKLDGQEVKFPVVMPKELWEMSGRYYSIGSEMARWKDRADHDMVLGMTHEEAAVHFAMNTINSYQKLPCMIYQIQTKFRDEPRSRGGLIRVREFTMKDAYSFHLTQEDLEEYYQKQYQAYNNIFTRIGMKNFISVKSDSGMMGGKVAHEFMLLTPDGEDELAICSKCGYKSNIEVAECMPIETQSTVSIQNEVAAEIFTGEYKSIEDVANFLNITDYHTIKAVVYITKEENNVVIAFVRGDLEVEESKLKKVIKKEILVYDSSKDEELAFGNLGPKGLPKNVMVVFDRSLKVSKGMVVGANKPEYHVTNFDIARDLGEVDFYDIAKVRAGDRCPVCGMPLEINNGIEIGNIFQLGSKYTESMGMTILNEKGESIYPIMGCYGIGIGRAIASLVQDSHDEKGMILPVSIAPWTVYITPIRIDNEEVNKSSWNLYDELNALDIDTVIDDRNCSAGIKFADADLFGMPFRVVISPKSLEKGEAEIKIRATGEVLLVKRKEVVSTLQNLIQVNE